jgi:hydroxymethylpyrimidine/phosphomethylpyrimidine kinase
MNPKVVLTVAGTDSGGAAGIAADLTTFAALGAHGAAVVSAVTAQDTTAVHDLFQVPELLVANQLRAVLDDLPVAAAKTGLLASPTTITLVARTLAGLPLVVDPVLASSTGAVFGGDTIRTAYLERLVPVATVVTPNLREARALLGHDEADAATLAHELTKLGPAAVVTGGDTDQDELCTDWLALPGRDPQPLRHPRVDTRNDHGTGCTFSAALAVGLAYGDPLPRAVADAVEFTARQLRVSRTWTLGRGRGPIAHLTDSAPEDRKAHA